MKKIISTVMASAALFSAVPAMANPILAEVTVQKGPSGPVLNCTFEIEFDTPNPGDVSISVVPPSDLGCYTIDFNPNANTGSYPTHNYTGPGSNFTISNIDVDTTITPGDCAGSLTAVWNGTDWDVINAVLPEKVAGTGDCTIDGVVFP